VTPGSRRLHPPAVGAAAKPLVIGDMRVVRLAAGPIWLTACIQSDRDAAGLAATRPPGESACASENNAWSCQEGGAVTGPHRFAA
jgi:hypothetical protein